MLHREISLNLSCDHWLLIFCISFVFFFIGLFVLLPLFAFKILVFSLQRIYNYLFLNVKILGDFKQYEQIKYFLW